MGISRPQTALAETFVTSLSSHGLVPDNLGQDDLTYLKIISPLVDSVEGSLKYAVSSGTEGMNAYPGERNVVRAVTRNGQCAHRVSTYDVPRPAAGTKRTVLRRQRAAWRTANDRRGSGGCCR